MDGVNESSQRRDAGTIEHGMRLHADLTILAKLCCALAKARALPLAAYRSVVMVGLPSAFSPGSLAPG